MPRRAACRRGVCLDSSFRWDLRGIDQRVQSRILSCLWGRRWKERSAIEHVATDKCSVLTVDRTVIISIDAVGVRWDRSFAARDLQGERDVRDIVLAVGIHVACCAARHGNRGLVVGDVNVHATGARDGAGAAPAGAI